MTPIAKRNVPLCDRWHGSRNVALRAGCASTKIVHGESDKATA